MAGVGTAERANGADMRITASTPKETSEANVNAIRERSEALEDVVRRAPPTAPDAQTAPRPAAAPSPPMTREGTASGRAGESGQVAGETLEHQLLRASLPSQQWPAIRVGQGVLIERRQPDGRGYQIDVHAIRRIDDGAAELVSRGTGEVTRVSLESLRQRIAWQYGHASPGHVREDGVDVTWKLKTQANLTANEPAAMTTETTRAVMRAAALRFDAALRTATEKPEVRERWERVMALQGRQRELVGQRRELQLGLEARVKNRPLRLSALLDDVVPTTVPSGLGGARAGLKALASDGVENAHRAQIAALDQQVVDLSLAAALVASEDDLRELAKTSSDPMVLAMAREDAGETLSAAELLGHYLDNAEAALQRGSVSASLIATSAALQPHLLMESEQHGSMHRLPENDGRRDPSLTMAVNQLIAEGKLGKRELVHSSAQLRELVVRLTERELVALNVRREQLRTRIEGSVSPVESLSQTERARRQNKLLAGVRGELTSEIERLRAIESSASHRTFEASGGSALVARADALTRRALSEATQEELLEFGRGVADVFDSVNTWVMAGAMAATRGIGVATFARSMPQVGELLLAYRAGRTSSVALRAAANRLAVGNIGTAATFTSLNNLALDAIGQERYIDWSPAAFATNLLAFTAFDYLRARSFVRNIETAPALQSSLGLRLHEGRLMAQQAAEQLAGMSAVGIAATYARNGNLDAAEQVITANVQFLVAMAAVGKLSGNKTVVPREVTRVEQLLRESRRLPESAVEQRRALIEQAVTALQGMTDTSMPGRAAQLAAEVLATSRVAPRPPAAANVPTAFADRLHELVTPLLRKTPFRAAAGPVTRPGEKYVAVFPGHPLDGDAVMSALAFVRALRAAGVEAYVVTSQPLPRNLREHGPRPDEVLNDAQAILRERPPAFAVGVDSQVLFGRNADAMPTEVPMLRVDHHKIAIRPSRNVGPRSATWVDPQSQSSGQMVADIIELVGQTHARRFDLSRNRVGLDARHSRDINEPLLVAAYTDVWGGAARPLVNANDATLGFLRELASRTDATAALARLGGQLPIEVRRALEARTSATFYGGGGSPRTGTEITYSFNEALALLERMEGKGRGFDHHRDLKGQVLDKLDGQAQLSDVVFSVVPEANAAGVAGTRFFLRSYQHSDAVEMTTAIRAVAVQRFPDKAQLIDVGGKPQVGGGWMPLSPPEASAIMQAAVTQVLAAWDAKAGTPVYRGRRSDPPDARYSR